MINTALTYGIIHYFVMLGRRTDPNPIATLPPLCMRHNLLHYLTSLPHNVYHYLHGCDYLQRVMLSGEKSGLEVDFIFNDSIEEPSFSMVLSKGLNVFLICTDNDDELIEMNISLSRVCTKNSLFWLDEKKKEIFIMPRVVTSAEEFWDYLFEYAQPLMKDIEAPLCVPLCGGSVEFPYFRPANITFFTLASALGNWGIGSYVNSHKEKEIQIKKTQEALADMYGWKRQEKAVDILSQLYGLCQDAFKTASGKTIGFPDQNYPPIVIAAPYTTKDVRDLFKMMAKSEKPLQSIDKVVEMEQTPNYFYDVKVGNVENDLRKIDDFIRLFHVSRLDFLDIVANLHCSFRFSPYLRLPLLCKSLNTELSFVSAKNNMQLAYSKDRMAYNKAIHKVGETMAQKLLAPKTAKMLEKMPAQIVAMTDLPIEWMEVNGVPLGFTHDVCRMPETPSSGMLTHYGIARFSNIYRIPEDILSKTLVVYGCREDAFKKWQDKADICAQTLGAKTVVCQSIDEFEKAVKQHKPDLLIIDTHGGTDLRNHQSFIYMGDDKVYPKDISTRGISARLVFISACNTAPCYNDVNTVANALLEVGASAVTSSYLPLDVMESSTLYIRILNQLNQAARQDIHRNWLAFISHILRTSFIMTPLVENAQKKSPESMDPMLSGKVNMLSMSFENRAELYRKLKGGEKVEGLKYDFSKVVPHYLMYTTIGRADLIMFESSMKKRKEEYEKMMKDE